MLKSENGPDPVKSPVQHQKQDMKITRPDNRQTRQVKTRCLSNLILSYPILYLIHLIPYTLYFNLIPYTLYLIPYTIYHVPYIELLSFVLCLISCTLYIISFILYLILCYLSRKLCMLSGWRKRTASSCLRRRTTLCRYFDIEKLWLGPFPICSAFIRCTEFIRYVQDAVNRKCATEGGSFFRR